MNSLYIKHTKSLHYSAAILFVSFRLPGPRVSCGGRRLGGSSSRPSGRGAARRFPAPRFVSASVGLSESDLCGGPVALSFIFVSVVFLCCCHATSCAPHGLRYGRFGSGATPDQVDRTVTWRSSSCVFASLPPVHVVSLGSSGSRRRTAFFVISRTVVADLWLHVKLGCFCMVWYGPGDPTRHVRPLHGSYRIHQSCHMACSMKIRCQ